MTRRQAILSLFTACSVCLLSTGCLGSFFERRRPDVDPPPDSHDPVARKQEKVEVESPWNPHPAGQTVNPRNALPESYPGTILYAQFFLPADTPRKPGPIPEPPGASAEQETPALAPIPPPETDPPLVAALRRVLDKNPSDALELLKQYDLTTRELLVLLLPFTARLGEGGLDHASPQELNALLDQLNELSAALRARAPLSLKKVCFCRRINGFGDYEPLPPNPEFQGGTDHRLGGRVRIYAEVRNFRSVPKGNVYETYLVTSLRIQDAQGKSVGIQIPNQNRPTITHSLRSDYFMNIEFSLPPLPDGQYTLFVQVADHTSLDGQPVAPRMAREKCLDFRVSRGAGLHASAEGPKRRAAE
jgi:hypothetical protein